jgi:CRISPR-associated protein Cmr1
MSKSVCLTYQVSFNTPAFLGNAEQQAQWRTPPFKALLRQWWRVVKAPDVGYDHRELLRLESELFGSAGDDSGGGRSKVQLRLSGWADGTLSNAPNLKSVPHPETKTRDGKPISPKADVYLGFGPITTDGMRKAIDPASPPNILKLRCPSEYEADLRKAMQLAAWFGTLGSRARNGWGSLHIEGDGILGWADLCDSKLTEQSPLRTVPVALADRLASEWPHAVGLCTDGRPSVWRVVAGKTQNAEGKTIYSGFDNWRQVMEQLAGLKIGFRTQFKLNSGAPHSRVEDRHVLAYPVTNHGLAGLPNARLANQMRFKVAKSKDGKFFGLITHLPCAMPRVFFERSSVRPPEIQDQIAVWQQVHEFLNTQSPTLLNRIRKG